MSKTQLTVPTPDTTENPGTLTQIQPLQQWMKELPYANPLQTAKLLLKSLTLLNRHPGSIANRTDLMTCYHTPFHQLADSARKKNRTSAHRDAAELYSLTEKITIEISYGYKIAIKEQHYFQKGKVPIEQQTRLVYLALDSLILSLLFTFAEHRQEPGHIWPEILQLYLLAEKLRLSNEPVDDPQHKADSNATIRTLFKSIVLIMLLDPSKLQQNEIWQVYSYLTWWGEYARITTLKSAADGSGGRFVIDLQGSGKPHAFSQETPPKNPESCLLLDSIPLCNLINQQMQTIGTKTTPSVPGLKNLNSASIQQLLRNMLVAWHLQPQRRHPRQERYDWLIIACGITDIAHFLKYGGIVNTAPSESMLDEELVTIGDAISPHQVVTHNTFRWRQTNISKSGIGLEVAPDNSSSLQVGQLVLMESERSENGENWIIGVVRRFIARNKDTTEVGVQFIQGSISAASIKPMVFGTTDIADFQPALLLDRGEKHPSAIITPHLLYHPEREYFVDGGKHLKTRIFADKLLQSTCCFERFEYHTIQLHG
ncbi:MAG: hypothetical protein RPU32_00460 [Candidatus Sedimenticola sp. (ex Thyasira tokunagai)]